MIQGKIGNGGSFTFSLYPEETEGEFIFDVGNQNNLIFLHFFVGKVMDFFDVLIRNECH